MKDDTGEEFDWDAEEQGIILGAFYYGYLVTQVGDILETGFKAPRLITITTTKKIPGGYLAEKYGGKWVIGLGVLTTAVFTLLTPVCARAGKGVLIMARVVEGLGEGVALPAMQAMISKWAPTNERGTLAAYIFAGEDLNLFSSQTKTNIFLSS